MDTEKAKNAALALFLLCLSAAIAICIILPIRIILLTSPKSLPDVPNGPPPSGACSLWTDGVLTCNVFNPANGPANVATLVTFTCKQDKNREETYHETVIAEEVPERGWSSVVLNSEGYARFYKGVQHELESKSNEVVALAHEAGIAISDLSAAQKKIVDRTVFDVCELKTGPSHLTLTARHRDVDIIAALKTLWGS